LEFSILLGHPEGDTKEMAEISQFQFEKGNSVAEFSMSKMQWHSDPA
jgi:hypothetical protein